MPFWGSEYGYLEMHELLSLLTGIIREATDIGMQRLTLTDSDKQVRDWFVKTTESLGCKVSIDAMGTYQELVLYANY